MSHGISCKQVLDITSDSGRMEGDLQKRGPERATQSRPKTKLLIACAIRRQLYTRATGPEFRHTRRLQRLRTLPNTVCDMDAGKRRRRNTEIREPEPVAAGRRRPRSIRS